MTTELEKQFFDTFGIEVVNCDNCSSKPFASEQCYQSECNKQYLTITDTHYLELICLLAENGGYICSDEVKELKKEVLKALIRCYKEYSEMDYKDSEDWAEELKTKVQALFKGE